MKKETLKTKKEIFEFIKIQTPNLAEILDFRIKDSDDENWFIGEHYIVKCLLKVPDTSIPMGNNWGRKEKTCLVNIKAFNRWVESKSDIKWI